MPETDALSDLGPRLRALREARGLSLAQAALRGGVSKSALAHWETGRRLPPAASLAGLLDAYRIPARLRARLLALADPLGARLVLADSTLGAPVSLGELLRAMRTRRRMAQAELARLVGRSQSAVARWERGDDVPEPATVQTLLFALGAGPDEIAAVASLDPAHAPSPDLEVRFHTIANVPHGLADTLWIGFEGELWWHAQRSPAAESLIQWVLNERIDWYAYSHRPEESAPLIDRAIRLGLAPLPRRIHGLAFGLVHSTLQRGGDVGAALQKLEAWQARLPSDAHRVRTYGYQALLLAELDEARGIAFARKAQESTRDLPGGLWLTTLSLAEIHLRHDDPERALEVLEGFNSLDTRFLQAQAMTRLGQPVPEIWLASFRGWRPCRQIPMYQARLAEIERGVQR